MLRIVPKVFMENKLELREPSGRSYFSTVVFTDFADKKSRLAPALFFEF
jgi:hypothetical protein